MKYLYLYESHNIVKCENPKCNHSWGLDKVITDDSYLCHRCGYDNKEHKFDKISLDKWKSERIKSGLNPNI